MNEQRYPPSQARWSRGCVVDEGASSCCTAETNRSGNRDKEITQDTKARGVGYRGWISRKAAIHTEEIVRKEAELRRRWSYRQLTIILSLLLRKAGVNRAVERNGNSDIVLTMAVL